MLPSIPHAKSFKPHSHGAKEIAFIEDSVSKLMTSRQSLWFVSVQIITYLDITKKVIVLLLFCRIHKMLEYVQI